MCMWQTPLKVKSSRHPQLSTNAPAQTEQGPAPQPPLPQAF